MFKDGEMTFGDNQAVTASAASTNVIDLVATKTNLGVGEPSLWAVFVVTEAFTDASSNSTVAVTLETDTADTFGSATTVQTLGTFSALSAVGTKLQVRIQPFTTPERYLRAYYTVANGDLSTGKITGFITPNVDAFTALPSGVTIIN